MTSPTTSMERVTVDGKFFRCGGRKFHVKGVTYGPFAPDETGGTFGSPAQAGRDFTQILELKANVLRAYYVPPRWFLDLVATRGLRILIDIPWAKHLCFLDSKEAREAARRTVREAVEVGKGHPAVFAYSVVNEISAEIVRWSGVRQVERFIDSLVTEAKTVDPGCLCTFTSFPPTEYLRPQAVDFVCFNVYLHQRQSFEAYLARLQTLADTKPLVLGEFGMDSIREGEVHKCEFLQRQIEGAFRAGLAGTVIFSFTDDWWRGGQQIDEWAFGVTTRDREPKSSFQTVQKQYSLAPCFPPARSPRVSVVVATYNGARTLKACLDSLSRLSYPDCEVIVVDDGSTDATPQIAQSSPGVRYLRQANLGLSAARNAGIAAATGEIVAFTDDDCRADEDWLFHLVTGLVDSDWVGIGGHNFLPPDDSAVAAAVMASPGGPAHVMLTDREAEHIPGCNMAFYKWALDDIGGFDPVFRKAGDDVDVCWRLQDRERRIGFSPAAFVWHYRRSTVKAYFRQQAGYGEAEALLALRHPERFNSFGGGIWQGRIYSSSLTGVLLRGSVIYHGIFGSGFFQRLYEPAPFQPLMLCTAPTYHAFVNIPLLLGSAYSDALWPLAITSLSISIGVCVLGGIQARLPASKIRWWSRLLVAALFFLQPIVRGWARVRSQLNRFTASSPRPSQRPAMDAADLEPDIFCYWSKGGFDRYSVLQQLGAKLAEAGLRRRPDTGWNTYDIEVSAGACARLRLTTVTEELELGHRTMRCRMQSTWSGPARLIFWIAAVAIIALIYSVAGNAPWVWMAAVALPLLHGWFENERRSLLATTESITDAVASELQMVKLPTPGAPSCAQRG